MSTAGNAPHLDAVDYDPFEQAPLARVVPVTEPQREVWLADKLGREGSLAYNESVSLRLRGALDERALRLAVRELGERHESLRATVSPSGDELCIASDTVLELVRHDLGAPAGSGPAGSGLAGSAPAGSASDAAARDDAVRARLRHAVETAFDLERGPLVRVELLALAGDDHLLVITAHHIVCDGWSFGVLARDLAALYASHVGHTGAAIAPALSFADYAREQAGRAQTPQHHDDERYWLGQFAQRAPDLDLPADRPRPRQRSFTAGREDVVLDAALVASLRQTGARRGASLFATLFTGFSTLMRRLSGQTDVVVGIAAAGQAVGGHDALVGHCVNILPVRTDAQPGTAFSALLDATAATLLDAFEHQQYTFGTLLQKLALPRDPSRLPLVNVLFNLDQPLDEASVRFPGLQMEFSANPRSYENFELFVNAVPVDGAIRLECQYNRDLYDAASVRGWMQCFDTLLRCAVADPDAAWDVLGWLSPEAMQDLLALQPAPTAFDRDLLVHQRFALRAASDPDRVALSVGDQSISYAELDQRSNAVAHALRARGIGRGALVGVCLQRGPELYVAVFGILKAGAAFVPLDPGYPTERLAFMVEDAGMSAVVSVSELLDTVDVARDRAVLLDADLDAPAWQRTDPFVPDELSAGAESPAYVIYTSGSTGKPKGVVVPHRALVNLLCSMQRRPGVSKDDAFVAVTTMSFDMSIPELFLPLVAGARVVVASRDDARDGAALRRLLETSGATMMQATPSGWRVLLESGWNGGPAFKALTGGEGLPQDLGIALRDRCGQLWNMYGPTETTVWSTCAQLHDPARGIGIGRPIDNTCVWVMDDNGQPCPVGVPGEIWIGGEGVTLGYLNRPELTAERFVADRYSAVPQARLYRTGDRGRWRGDRTLEHLGRLDFQVKVRGYRIEPGEIEANLASHADVARCVVVAREDRPGDVRLVAYVVPRQPLPAETRPARAEALCEHLRGTLPGYMIPQHVVFLDAIPLSPAGKVDRKALPVPDVQALQAADRVAPRTDLERAVAAVMESVLALPAIGVDDDFFALGGHSLLAAQLTARLNRELGARLSLRALFDAPTVARLAAAISEQTDGEGAGAAPAPAIARRPDQRTAPLSRMQERLRLLDEFNPGQLTYHAPSAHRLVGPLDLAAFERAFDALLQRQSVLRTTIGLDEDEQPVQIVHGLVVSGLSPVEDLSALPVAQRDRTLHDRLEALTAETFDLSRAPLFRARLFRLADEEHVLFFMPHHVVWDGWSFDLMYADLSELYAAELEARPPRLPDLPVSYGDFAAWHNAWVQGPEYARQLAFWRERLGGGGDGRRAQPLPTDLPRRPGMSGQGASQHVGIDRAVTDALHGAARQFDATLFVVLLTAYSALLGRVTGQERLVVGTPVRGRNWPETEGLMGYFTNLLPLQVDIDPAQPFAQAVRQVKAAVLDSFGNPDVRLEDLARELNLRGAGGAVLYQSLFSFQDIRQRVVQWGNVRHLRHEVFQPGATEDLGLWFVEDEHGLVGGLVYNADIFHEATASLLQRRYLQMLRTIAEQPMRTVEEITAFDDGQPVRIGRPAAPAASADALVPGVAGRPAAPSVATATPPAAVTTQPPASGRPASESVANQSAANPSAATQPPSQPPSPPATPTVTPVTPAAASASAASITDPRVRYLVELWTELLCTPVQPEDNFFDLGGNSMLGVQMAERVARETGLRIKLVRLAAQELREIAADLPASVGTADTPGVGSRLVRNVRRLFGRPSMDASP